MSLCYEAGEQDCTQKRHLKFRNSNQHNRQDGNQTIAIEEDQAVVVVLRLEAMEQKAVPVH